MPPARRSRRAMTVALAMLRALALPLFAAGEATAGPYASNATLIANAATAKSSDGPRVGVWGLAGTEGVSFTNSPISLETDLAYLNATGPGFTSQQYALAENLTWASQALRLGATLGGHGFDNPRGRSGTVNYGVYDIWFPSQSVTLAAKAGAFSGHARGGYAGGAGYWYATPDIGFFGSVDWSGYEARFQEADWTALAQVLPSHRLPVSVVAGYTRTQVSGAMSFRANTAFLALRFFWNRSGAVSLVGRERTGAVGWPGAFGPQGIGF